VPVPARRHHTVSRFLVDRFAWDANDRRRLCQLEVASGRNMHVGTRDATVVNHFYSIDIDNGERSSAVEEALGQVEGVAAPHIVAVGEGRLPEGTERAELALFLAMTWLRTPTWRYQQQSIMEQAMTLMWAEQTRHQALETMRHILGEDAAEMTDEKLTAMRDELVADLDEGRVGVDIPANNLIKLFLESCTAMGWVFFCLDWAVARTSQRFVLGDTPVSLFDPTPAYEGSGAGVLSSENVELFIPLDPRFGIAARPNPATLDALRDFAYGIRDMSDDEIIAAAQPLQGRWTDVEIDAAAAANLNLRTYCHAQRFIYGSQGSVTAVRAFARAHPVERRTLTPQPPRLHIVEDDPATPGVMRPWRIIEPQPRRNDRG
jgi:hypothetical protein